jgi:hypothetical protein
VAMVLLSPAWKAHKPRSLERFSFFKNAESREHGGSVGRQRGHRKDYALYVQERCYACKASLVMFSDKKGAKTRN